MRKLISENRYYLLSVAALLLFGGLLLLNLTKEEFTLWVNARYTLFTDYFFWTSSLLGTLWFSLLVLALVWWTKGWRKALQGLVCFASVAGVVQFLKHIVFPGTPRPSLHFEGVADLRLLDWVEQLKTESFPSGHTAAAFAIATFLALTLPRKQYHWLLALGAVCVAYARVYLSQHFITDVYTGMSIGLAVTFIVYWWTEKQRVFQRRKHV